jgi:16S rRNA G966 N2-methylase RsmD
LITDIPVTLIDPSPFQHRKNFDKDKLAELARNIKDLGLIQPITTRRVNGRYELIAGERRWRAAQLIDAPVIMARVVEATDAQARRMCAAENLQRDDLSAVEQVDAIIDMVDAELIEDDEYSTLAKTPQNRVKSLLGRMHAVQVNIERGAEIRREAFDFVGKFTHKVEQVFYGLPRPVEWSSFYRNDLAITDLDPAVREWAIDNKLNKSQAKALNEVKAASPAKFEEITTKGELMLVDAELVAVPVSELSANELKGIAKQERAKNATQELRLINVEPLPTSEPERIVKLGEWWQLGNHTLYCGDTSEPGFVDKLPVAALVFADPPYNAGAAEWDSDFVWSHDWLLDKAPVAAVTPGIVSIPDFHRLTTMRYAWSMACWLDNGMTRGALGFGNWIYIALFAKEGVSLYHQAQDFVRVSVLGADNAATDHKGRKPSELIKYLLETFTKDDDIVIDPFLGSGTTLLVAERLNRRCVGGDIDPAFCGSIILRWETMTGKKAQRING